MHVSEAELIEALCSPAAYPHEVAAVEHVRTHISHVFLAGDRAYKVKRAVDLDFVDMTALETRRRLCEEEVRLNSRLAPGVYLDALPVTRTPSGSLRIGGEGETMEWAVCMRRLPADQMLDVRLDAGAVDHRDVDALVERLARFHEACATGAGIDEHGFPEAVRGRILANLDEMDLGAEGEALGLFPKQVVAALRRHLLSFLESEAGRLASRVAAGRIREGHGDLHAANICRFEGEWIAFDCIEFRRDFRCLDTAAEVSFLAMDVAAHGCHALGEYLLRQAAVAEDDKEMPRLADLYRPHYAAVRAKVAALAALQSETDEERDRLVTLARRRVNLALGFIAPPTVVLTCGLPGSGKSVAARAIADALGAAVIRSDVVRKRLAGMAPTDRSGQAAGSTLYGEEMNARTLEAMRFLVEEACDARRSVVVDATNATRAWRDAFRSIAETRGVTAHLLWLDPPHAVIRERLVARATDPAEPSDAGVEVFERAIARFERPDEWPFEQLVVAADAPPAERLAERVLVSILAAPGPRHSGRGQT